LGDDKDGTMATRIAESMRLKQTKSQAMDTLSCLGTRDQQAWGKRADWCDYYGRCREKLSASPSSIIRTIRGIHLVACAGLWTFGGQSIRPARF